MRSKILFPLLVSTCSVSLLYSQANKFRRTFSGVTISSVSVTNDKGYIVSGFSSSIGLGSKDIVLIKTDSLGTISWQKTFGNNVNTNADDIASNAIEIPGSAGGFYVSGQFWNQSNQTYDVYVLKTDSAGSKLWSKTMYNGGYDKGMRVINAPGGGCYLTGWIGNSSKGYLSRLDNFGNIIWQNSINYFINAWILQDAAATSDGGLVACGYDNELGVYEMWIVKTNSSGTILWQKGYAMPGTYNFSYAICETNDHGFLLGGGSSGMNLVKTDSNGVVTWSKTYSGSGAYPRAYSVKQCTDGGYITLSNDVGNNQYLLKTDSAGNILWTIKYSGGYFINTVEQTPDGGYVLAMGSDLIKTDSSGISGCNETPFTFTSSSLAISTRITAATATPQAFSAAAADGSTSPSLTVTLPCPASIPVILENNSTEISLYPNPASKDFIVASALDPSAKITLIDASGRDVKVETRMDQNYLKVDCSEIASGIYFLSVKTGKEFFSGKIVKR